MKKRPSSHPLSFVWQLVLRQKEASMSTESATTSPAGSRRGRTRRDEGARRRALRAEGRQGAKKADGLDAVLDAIAKMGPADRALAERVHVTVTTSAPGLAPRTWYGMPAYANADGKIVVAFKNSGKFSTRYSTLEFQDAAHLDDGDIFAVSFAR